MTEKEAIEYIENQSWSKTRLGLDRSRQLMSLLGDPQKKLRFVHVAGSNGKGSACAMIAGILADAGYRVGFYSSPYLQSFNERIKINGNNISGKDLAFVVEKVKSAAEQMTDHPSQFELVTAAGFLYFLKEKCDIVVLEVGMGGEFDATNVIDAPQAAVIMNIGLEHTQYLGNTIEEIARTKGGIIKKGCPVVCYDSDKRAVEEIKSICKRQKASLIIPDFSQIKPEGSDLKTAFLTGKSVSLPAFQHFSYKGESYDIRLLGGHQLRNAVMAIETAKLLSKKYKKITKEAIARGLSRVEWPGRFEILGTDPLFILDGGHNPQCAGAMKDALREFSGDSRFIFLLGVLADKNYDEIIDEIGSLAERFICLTPDNDRAMPADELAKHLKGRGFAAESAPDIKSGIDAAYALMSKNENTARGIVAFGSLYLAGVVRTEMQKRRKI